VGVVVVVVVAAYGLYGGKEGVCEVNRSYLCNWKIDIGGGCLDLNSIFALRREMSILKCTTQKNFHIPTSSFVRLSFLTIAFTAPLISPYNLT